LIHKSPKIRKKFSNEELNPNKEDNFPASDKVGNDFFDHLNPHHITYHNIKEKRFEISLRAIDLFQYLYGF